MEKILVLTDFSENSINAYRYAVQLACQVKADILLVFSSNGQPISLTNQMQYSQMLYSFAKRYACDSRHKANPLHTECLISPEAWPKAISLLIKGHQPDLVIAGAGLLASFGKEAEKQTLQLFEQCPVIWVPEKASYQPLRNLAFVTDFTDQDPAVIEQIREFSETFNAPVSLVHFYSREDRSRLAEIKKAGSELHYVLGTAAVNYFLIEEEDMIEGLEDFAAHYPVDMFLLGTRDTHLADHYFQPVFRKTNSCQTAIPLLNLYQEKNKPCTGSCLFCREPKTQPEVAEARDLAEV